MRGAIVSLLVAGAALAQGKPGPDAGVVPRAADAGVARDAGAAPLATAVPVVEPQRAPVVPVADPELARLRREVADLRTAVERHSSQTEAITAALERLGQQIGRLQTDFSSAESRRADALQQQAARRQATADAVAGLAFAQQQLATGSTDIAAALSVAEGAFTGSALKALQSARTALANSDLNAVRYWLAVAVAESANPRE
jgi:hypothetical protein